MLMSFSFSNFLSYKDETIISFEPRKSNRLINHIISDGNNRMTKGVVCFGANASGKTNIIKALASLRLLILSNYKDKSRCKTFKINNDNKISSFKYKFSIDGEIVFYELTIDFENDYILNEKMYNGKIYGVYFDRVYKNGKIDISTTKKMSKEDKKFFDVYSMDFYNNQDGNFDSSFFLRYVARKRSDNSDFYKVFKNIFDEIMSTIIIYPDTEYGDVFGLINDNADFENFKELLQEYRIDVTDLVQENVTLESIIPDYKSKIKELDKLILELKEGQNFQVSINGVLLSISKNSDKEINVQKLTLRHGSEDAFEYYEESNGTRRLFDLLPLLMLKNDKSRLVLIDEIDQSLHTLLTQKLIKDFFNSNLTSKIQFLITTHDVNLLNQEILRGDEILLISKNNLSHASSVQQFSDFKRRADREVIGRYLNGEFGAIPKIS